MERYNNTIVSSNIVCPYCGKVYKRKYENVIIGGEAVDCIRAGIKGAYRCDGCHKLFNLINSAHIEYVTDTVDGEMTVEEHETMMKNMNK